MNTGRIGIVMSILVGIFCTLGVMVANAATINPTVIAVFQVEGSNIVTITAASDPCYYLEVNAGGGGLTQTVWVTSTGGTFALAGDAFIIGGNSYGVPNNPNDVVVWGDNANGVYRLEIVSGAGGCIASTKAMTEMLSVVTKTIAQDDGRPVVKVAPEFNYYLTEFSGVTTYLLEEDLESRVKFPEAGKGGSVSCSGVPLDLRGTLSGTTVIIGSPNHYGSHMYFFSKEALDSFVIRAYTNTQQTTCTWNIIPPLKEVDLMMGGPVTTTQNRLVTYTAWYTEKYPIVIPFFYWLIDDTTGITSTGGYSDNIGISWDTPGVHKVQVTAQGRTVLTRTLLVTVAEVITTPIMSLSMGGPITPIQHQVVTYTAWYSEEPTTTTLPVTFSWAVDGVPTDGGIKSGHTSQLSVTWTSPGTHTIGVVAQRVTTIKATLTVTVRTASQRVFLPLVSTADTRYGNPAWARCPRSPSDAANLLGGVTANWTGGWNQWENHSQWYFQSAKPADLAYWGYGSYDHWKYGNGYKGSIPKTDAGTFNCADGD